MTEILLNDLLRFDDETMERVKIRFNQSNGEIDPIELFLRDPELINTQYFLWKSNQRYFYEGQIGICFLKLTSDTWLLTTIKNINKDLNISGGINYEAEELEEFKKITADWSLSIKNLHSSRAGFIKVCTKNWWYSRFCVMFLTVMNSRAMTK